MTGQPTKTVKLDNGTGTFPTDVSTFVRDPDAVEVSDVGRTDEFDQPGTSELKLTFDNADGRFTNGTVVLVPDQTLIRFTEHFGATTRDRFTGRVTSLDLKWPNGGQEFATVDITATDVLADLGRDMRSMIEEEILLDNPTAYYTLGEAEGATAAGDTSGNGRAPLTPAGSGAAVAFGTGVGPTDGLTAAVFAGGQYLALVDGPIGAGSWSFAAFFSTTDAPGVGAADVIFGALFGTNPGSSSNDFSVGVTNGGVINGHGPVVNDGDVHCLVVTFDGTNQRNYVDGVLIQTVVPIFTGSTTQVFVGYMPFDANKNVWQGALSHVAIFDGVTLSGARAAAYAAALTNFAETTDARLTRLASYGGVAASTSSPSGQVMGSQATSGQTLFQALQDVATAEGGVLFADGSGDLVMQGRYYRTLRTTPDLTLDADVVDPGTAITWDTQQKINQVTVTRTGGAEQVVATPGVMARTDPVYPKSLELDVDTDEHALGAAQWVVAKHQDSAPRLASVTFDLGTSTHAEQLLQLDIGDHLQLTPMPSQLWAGSADYTVEGWTENVTEDEWTMTVNLLPWALQTAWILGDSTYGVLGTTTVLGY